MQQAQERKQQFDDLNITEDEEIKLGADVSAKIRERFGVVQDAAVHKYVALVGTMLTEQTTRPKLPWTFIVLDTDGVNAFAAPGGFVHITRGALALDQDRKPSWQACWDTRSRTSRRSTRSTRIRKSKGVQLGTSETSSNRGAFLDALANRAYDMVLENSFDRGDELDADKEGILLVQKAGYAGTGLSDFLARLAERNKGAGREERSVRFAPRDAGAHRQGQAARRREAWRGRWRPATPSNIKYQPTDMTKVAAVVEGSAGLTGGGKSSRPSLKRRKQKKRRRDSA